MPVIWEPDVFDIYTNTHHWIKEDTNFSPPPCPYDQFTCDDYEQTSKTNQRHSPKVSVLATLKQLVISVKNPDWNTEDYHWMN